MLAIEAMVLSHEGPCGDPGPYGPIDAFVDSIIPARKGKHVNYHQTERVGVTLFDPALGDPRRRGGRDCGAVRAERQRGSGENSALLCRSRELGEHAFQKAGLARHLGKSYTFEAVRFQGTPELIQAQAAGELEIAAHAYSSLALAIENAGMSDLRIIADEFQDGAPGYYSNEYFVAKDGPIKTIEDLKGKVSRPMSRAAPSISRCAPCCKKHASQDKRNVTIVEARFPTMPAMLQARKVVMFPGVLRRSPKTRKFRQMTRRLFRKGCGRRTQMVVWAARESFIKTHGEALADFSKTRSARSGGISTRQESR